MADMGIRTCGLPNGGDTTHSFALCKRQLILQAQSLHVMGNFRKRKKDSTTELIIFLWNCFFDKK